MKFFFQILIKFIFLSLFSSTGYAATVFTDNFDSGASALWGNERGGWNDSGGVYRSTSGGFSYTSLPDNLTDFSVEMDINNVWDGGVFLRSDYNGGLYNGISLITGGQGGGGRGVYWHEWTNGVHSPILNHSGSIFSSRSSFRLKIDVFGNTYSAFMNGNLVSTFTSSLYSSGRIALINNKLGQSFDNIVVSTDANVSVPETGSLFLLLSGLITLLSSRRFI